MRIRIACLVIASLLAAAPAQAQRIIQVQPSRDLPRNYGAVSPQVQDEQFELEPGLEDITPQRKRRSAPAPRRVLEPRTSPKIGAEAPAQKRTMLSAPATPEPGPSPVYPTPRWRNTPGPITDTGEISRIASPDPAKP